MADVGREWPADGLQWELSVQAWKGDSSVDSGLLRYAEQCIQTKLGDDAHFPFLAHVYVARISRAEVSSGAMHMDSLG